MALVKIAQTRPRQAVREVLRAAAKLKLRNEHDV